MILMFSSARATIHAYRNNITQTAKVRWKVGTLADVRQKMLFSVERVYIG